MSTKLIRLPLILPSFLLIVFLCVPALFVNAQADNGGFGNPDNGSFGTNQPTITNPLGSTNTLTGPGSLLDKIITIVIDIGTPIIILMIIYTGFLFVTAGGDVKKLTEAKGALLTVVIGTAIVLGAYAISTIIANTVSSLSS